MNYQSLIELVPWTFVAQILNLLIQAWLFKKFLFKPVKEIIAKRQAEIDGLYSDAENAKNEAETAQSETAAIRAQAEDQAEHLLADAKRSAQDAGDAIIADARKQAVALKEKAQEDIALEKKRAVNEIKNELSDIAVDLAAKVAEKEIDAAQHETLISEYIDRIGAGL